MNAVLALLVARYKSLWRILWRPQGRAGNLFGLMIGLLILGGIAIGSALGALSAAQQSPEAALALGGVIIGALQFVTVLGAGFSGRMGIYNDPRPLQPYPLRAWQWALASIAGQALDMGTLYPLAGTLGLSLGLLAAGVPGWIAALLLWPGHLLLSAEIVGLSGIIARLSASRRFQDRRQYLGILVSLGFSSLYLFFFLPRMGVGTSGGGFGALAMRVLALATPSGALLSVVRGAVAGDLTRLAAGGVAVFCHAALGVALVLLAVRMASSESGTAGERIARGRILGWLTRPLPAGMAAMLMKDLAYLRREPGLAGRLLGNYLQTVLLLVFVALSPANIRASSAGFYFFIAALSALGAGRMLLYNQWGWEGPGITFLLSGRFTAWELLGAKWLLGLIVVGLDAVFTAIALKALLGGTPEQWLIYWLLVAIAPLGAAVGGYLSMLRPYPLLGRGRMRAPNRPAEWSMLPLFMGARFVMMAAAAPIGGLWLLIKLTKRTELMPLAFVFAVGYALTLSLAALPLLAKRFSERRPELLEALAIPEENI